DLILRQLMSEAVLHYPVVQKNDYGEMATVIIEKKGPVSFMVTTTHNKLHPENETRMLSIEADDSANQTRKVTDKVALIDGLNRSSEPTNLRAWQAYQRWLALGVTQVFIPFAAVLANKIESINSVRLRRDFSQLLSAIKVHALLHREHRRRSKQGSIIATIKDDYAAILPLVADLLATASEI